VYFADLDLLVVESGPLLPSPVRLEFDGQESQDGRWLSPQMATHLAAIELKVRSLHDSDRVSARQGALQDDLRTNRSSFREMIGRRQALEDGNWHAVQVRRAFSPPRRAPPPC
jgi:hypothetical protein